MYITEKDITIMLSFLGHQWFKMESWVEEVTIYMYKSCRDIDGIAFNYGTTNVRYHEKQWNTQCNNVQWVFFSINFDKVNNILE